MKICLMSDTHGHALPDPGGADLVIHAGDGTMGGSLVQVASFSSSLYALGKPVIFVPGNHDVLFENKEIMARDLLPINVTSLISEATRVGGLSLWGTPWTPWFNDWAFNNKNERNDNVYAGCPTGVDILITHGPPYGILDTLTNGEHVGSRELLAELDRIRPRIHVFGHIHSGYGRYYDNYTQFFNAAICNDAYQPVNPAFFVNIEEAR